MATQTISHSTAAAFQQMGVQRLEALEHWDWYEEVPARIADELLDFALVVAFARSAKPILEKERDCSSVNICVRCACRHRGCWPPQSWCCHTGSIGEPRRRMRTPDVAVAEGFRCLCRIADDEAGVRMRQVKSEESSALTPPMMPMASPKSARACPAEDERHEHPLRPLPPAGDIVLHDRDTAREPRLIAQPLEYPLRRVLLLLRL